MTDRIVAVVVPKWGLEMTEGTVSSWLKQVGEVVVRGEPLLEVESEKIVNSVDAPADGVLRRVLLDAGSVGRVGSLVGIIADAAVSNQDIDRYVTGYVAPTDDPTPTTAADVAATSANDAARPAAARGGSATVTGPARISPPVRRLAESLGVPLVSVTGSGPNGRILQEDVERVARTLDASTGGDATAAPTRRDTAPATASEQPAMQPWSATRRSIARKMQDAARDVPHFYLVIDVDANPLLALRERLRTQTAAPSINDLVVHAVARALPRHPQVNAHYSEAGLLTFSHAHVAVAVATPDGVLAPVLRHADRLSLPELREALDQMRSRVNERRLAKGDLDGGSFTVSNLGMHGIREFTSIITPPQCASLAVGAVRRAGSTATLALTLSCDHRVLDGTTGAAFLRDLKELLENP